MKSRLFTMFAAVALAVGVLAPAARSAPADQGQHIDVVICLDVSGSMQGLVDSAKIKLWDIVNDLAKVKPAPQLRVALYSYGHQTYDAQRGWVRKEVDLSTDLDEVYRKLNGLTINGGEEYVARVSQAALLEQPWSKSKDALKLVFVCGNEPADQDPTVQLKSVAALAKDKGVVVNTIYCNWNHPNEIGGWQKFALDAGGKYAMIDHNKAVVQIETPFDKKLLELNTKLNGTYINFSGAAAEAKKENQTLQDANAAKAGAPALAGRVQTKGGALYKNSDWCIICRSIEDPKFDVNKLPEDQMPEEFKKLKPEERTELIKKKIAEREKINKEIGDISASRSKFIAEEMKKKQSDSDKSLDVALKAIIRDQAAAKGMKIPD